MGWLFSGYLCPQKTITMKKVLILGMLLWISQVSGAQGSLQDSLYRQQNDIFQKINIKQDSDLIDLVNLHIRRNQQGGMIQGYRIEIFFSSDLNARQKAQNIKSEFLAAYPDYNVYISWISPDFKVRVGNFKTKNEALKVMNEIKGQFPKAFVVPDIIELPKLY
jgi:hypothetical protein